jgi:hypothetical protein
MKRKKALHTWQTFRPAVDRVLLFATMKIESAAQVERSLSHAALDLMGLGENRPLKFTLSDGVWHPFTRLVEPSGYQKDQKILLRWLTKIVNWKKLRTKEKETILREIRPWTERSRAIVNSQIDGERLVRTISHYDAANVQQVIGDVMYLLFEHGIAQEGGIGACPQCESYFVKDRADQKVCSNRCRQRQYRRLSEVSR